MKFKTSHFLLAGIAIVLLSQGENVQKSIRKNNQIRQEQSSFNDRIRENRQALKQAEKLSEIALKRFEKNCIHVVGENNGKPILFKPGSEVMDSNSGELLRDGVFVCNQLGETAVVESGKLADIARVAEKDKLQLQQLLGGQYAANIKQ